MNKNQQNQIKQLKSENRRLKKLNSAKAATEDLDIVYQNFAQAIVDPGGYGPCVFPSPTPGLAQSIVFPLQVEVSGLTDFMVRIAPEKDQPLMITHSGGEPESSDSYGANFDYNGSMDISAARGCIIESEYVDGKTCLPVSSAAGATVSWGVRGLQSRDWPFVTAYLQFYNGSSWTTASTANVTVGYYQAVTGITLSSSVTHWTVEIIAPVSADPTDYPEASLYSAITPSVGTLTCSSSTRENIVDLYTPEWSGVFKVCEAWSIPAADMLVTYQGSTLDNSGAIAAHETSSDVDMENSSYYQTITKRRRNVYEGRLASEGRTEGGSHWHCQHQCIDGYVLKASHDEPTTSIGYVAVSGVAAGQTVRIRCNFNLNFRTQSPQFTMALQPRWGGFAMLLEILRHDVPMVTSNDSHFKKAKNLAGKVGKKTAQFLLDNPHYLTTALSLLL